MPTRFLLLIAVWLICGLAEAAASDVSICLGNRHDDAAISACDRALSSGRASGSRLRSLYFSRGKHFYAQRETAKAFDDFRQAASLGRVSQDLANFTFLSGLLSGRIDEAVQFEATTPAVSDDPIVHLVRAVQAIRQQQYANARQELARSGHGAVDQLTAGLLSAWATLGSGDATTAAVDAGRISGSVWYTSFKDVHSGLLLELGNRAQEAGAALEKAHRDSPGAVRIAQLYAGWLSRNRGVVAARSALAETEKFSPHQPVLTETQRLLSSGTPLPRAINTAQEGAAEALYNIGVFATRSSGDTVDLSLAYLRLADYLRPDDPLIILAIGNYYEVLGKPPLAVAAYQRIPESSPLWQATQILIADDFARAGRYDDGVQLLNGLIERNPRDVGFVIALGDLQRGTNRFSDCATTYTRGIATLSLARPADWLIYYDRGICYERLGQWARAEPDFRKALALQPDQPLVLNYLGYALIDQGLKTDEALAMIRRAVEQRPDDGYIIDSLGWAYYRTGRLADAKENLERAVRLKPDDPTIRLHLGDLYWALGFQPQARALWLEARQRNPGPQDLAAIDVRLRGGAPPPPGPRLPGSTSSGPILPSSGVVSPRQPPPGIVMPRQPPPGIVVPAKQPPPGIVVPRKQPPPGIVIPKPQ